jgi:hypothetical protein
MGTEPSEAEGIWNNFRIARRLAWSVVASQSPTSRSVFSHPSAASLWRSSVTTSK